MQRAWNGVRGNIEIIDIGEKVGLFEFSLLAGWQDDWMNLFLFYRVFMIQPAGVEYFSLFLFYIDENNRFGIRKGLSGSN